MAFPGTYNISYYRGDTLEFRIYPKDSSGAAFDLSTYTPAFTVAPSRGTSGIVGSVECYSAASADGTYILCAITPQDGLQLSAGTQYVYDVEITDLDTEPSDDIYYDKVFTLLTGTVTVTDHVTGASTES